MYKICQLQVKKFQDSKKKLQVLVQVLSQFKKAFEFLEAIWKLRRFRGSKLKLLFMMLSCNLNDGT